MAVHLRAILLLRRPSAHYLVSMDDLPLPLFFKTPSGLRRVGTASFSGNGPGIANVNHSRLSPDDCAFVDAFLAEHGERWRMFPRTVDGAEAAVIIPE